jgi:hypothetical protein
VEVAKAAEAANKAVFGFLKNIGFFGFIFGFFGFFSEF